MFKINIQEHEPQFFFLSVVAGNRNIFFQQLKKGRELPASQAGLVKKLPLACPSFENRKMFSRIIFRSCLCGQFKMGFNNVFHIAQESRGPLLAVISFIDQKKNDVSQSA